MVYLNTLTEKMVAHFLVATGQDDAQEMGETQDQSRLEGQSSKLVANLQARQVWAGRILIAAILVLCAIFLVGVALVFYYRDSPTTISILFGGNFFSLLVIVYWLRRLWLEKTVLDTLLILVASMPPTEAAKTITQFHFKAIRIRDAN